MCFDDLNRNNQELITKAIQARDVGNQPVSQFHVGAAIRVEGAKNTLYTGSNFENVNFNGSTHAEQHAVNCALQERKDQKYHALTITAIAVCGALSADNINFTEIITHKAPLPIPLEGIDSIMSTFITPCGHCRQIYDPYITNSTQLLLLNKQGLVAILPAKSLLPFSFSKIE